MLVRTKWVAVWICAFGISACAQATRPTNMAASLSGPPAVSSLVENSIQVGQVAGGEETNPLWTSEISATSFRSALQQSLLNYRLYSPDGPYRLDVVLVNVDQPLFGFDITVTTTVSYRLLDPKGVEVWTKNVSAPYTATMSDAFIGVERLRIANEGAAKENIRRALDSLVQEVKGADLVS